MTNRISITNICSFFLLIILLFGQFLIFSREAKGRVGLGGDEPYCTYKAEYFAKNRALPKANDIEMALGKKSGDSDFRAAGYPLFLAIFGLSETGFKCERWKSGLLQFLLMSAVLMILYLIACAFLKGSKWTYLVALMLGIQPWAFEYSASFYPDSLAASITTLALIGLFMFIKTKKSGREAVFLVIATLLLCLTFMLRIERILLVPIIVFTAITIKSRKLNSILKYGCYSGLIFILFCGLQIGYRHYLTGKAELIPKYRWNGQGALDWTYTWFGTEKSSGQGFAYGSADKRLEKLPPRAFGDDYEKQEITRALSLYAKSGYTEEVDRIFEAVANKRIKDNFLVNYGLTRVWRATSLWVNNETNAQVLNVLKSPPKIIRKSILGMLLILKLIIYLLAVISLFMVFKHLRRRSLSGYHYLTILMLLNIFFITVFFGLVFGDNEHRYVLGAWPAMLWCAISAIIDLSKRRERSFIKYEL